MGKFNPSSIVTDPDLLFGRKKLLDDVCEGILSGSSFFVWGERRSGKTSFLNCLQRKLFESPNVISALIDYKSLTFITTTADAYRWMSSMLLNVALCKNDCIELRVFDLLIYKMDTEYDYYELLKSVGDSECVAGLLDRVIQAISSAMEVKRFILLIDEYEHLFERTFGAANGFMYIRSLASDPKFLFSYILSGSIHWRYMSSSIGSPELNNSITKYLQPLKWDDFQAFYNYELSTLDAGAKKEIVVDKESLICSQSGGIPFYAKVIASGLMDEIDKEELFSVLSQYFDERYKNMLRNCGCKSLNEVKCMIDNKANQYSEFLRLGIIKKDGDQAEFNGDYWKSYIDQRIIEANAGVLHLEIEILKKRCEIERLIGRINVNQSNVASEELFVRCVDDYKDYDMLSTMCLDESDFICFAGAMFKIFYERTANTIMDELKHRPVQKNRESLPKMIRSHEFMIDVGSIRHNFGGHKTSSPFWNSLNGSLSKADLLMKYLGKKLEPAPHEYLIFQSRLLAAAIEYLNKVIQIQSDITLS